MFLTLSLTLSFSETGILCSQISSTKLPYCLNQDSKLPAFLPFFVVNLLAF
jgi:hypothetical protein